MAKRVDEKVHPAMALRSLMVRAGYGSQKEFAQALGYADAPGVQKYLDTSRAATPLPSKLIIKLLDSIVGRGNPPITQQEILALGEFPVLTSNRVGPTVIQAGPELIRGRNVPLFGIEEVMKTSPLDKTARDGRVYVFAESPIGERAFGVRLPDASMEPELMCGTIAIIDPDETPSPGDYVLAIVPNEDSAVLRRFRLKGKDSSGRTIIELAASNNDYPSYSGSDGDIRILGKLMVAVISRRY